MIELTTKQYSSPTTTANSAIEGRLKVDASSGRKKKKLKKLIGKIIKR